MKKIFTVFFATMLAVSCNFLDEPLKGGYSSKNYYTCQSKAEMATNAIYNSLYGNTLWIFGDVASDDAVKGGNAGDQVEIDYIDNFSAAPDNGCISTYWTNTYETISRANNVIANVPSMNFDAEIKNRLVGEAKFLRAYAYFNLVNIFGEVPLKLLPQNTSEAIHVGLSSVSDIYKQIDADLSDAVKVLPESYAVDKGRATVGAAYALLAKSKLFQQDYASCLTAIGLIPNIYSLEPVYADLFKAGAEDSKESVFAIRYLNNTEMSLGNNLNVWFSPSVEGGYYFNAPTQAYVDCFTEKTVLGDVDPRLDASIGRDGKPWFNGMVFSSAWSEATGYLVKKYDEDLSDEYAKSQSTIPQHIIRYADVLLMKAEALNESDRTNEAIPVLQTVRNRASLPPIVTPISKNDARDIIRNERRKELGFEFHRFFDVMRYGKTYATSVLGEDLKWTSSRFYYPIPVAETEANNAIKQ